MSETLSAEDAKFFDDYAADKTPVDAPAPPGEEQIEVAEQQSPAANAQEQKKAPDTVPHAKFEEERVKRQRIQAEAQTLREQNAALQARLEERARAAEQPKPAPGPEPTLETDPTGFLRRQAEDLNALRQWRQQQEAGAAQRQQFQQIIAAGQASEAEYAKDVPDYVEAATHLRASRDKELQIMGYSDPAQRLQIIQQDVLAMTAMALQRGENLGKIIYEGAVLRGYTKKQAQAAADKVVDAEATRRRGEDFAAGIGGAGNAPSGALTHEALMEMDDEAFLKAINSKDARRLMGA